MNKEQLEKRKIKIEQETENLYAHRPAKELFKYQKDARTSKRILDAKIQDQENLYDQILEHQREKSSRKRNLEIEGTFILGAGVIGCIAGTAIAQEMGGIYNDVGYAFADGGIIGALIGSGAATTLYEQYVTQFLSKPFQELRKNIIQRKIGRLGEKSDIEQYKLDRIHLLEKSDADGMGAELAEV